MQVLLETQEFSKKLNTQEFGASTCMKLPCAIFLLNFLTPSLFLAKFMHLTICIFHWMSTG